MKKILTTSLFLIVVFFLFYVPKLVVNIDLPLVIFPRFEFASYFTAWYPYINLGSGSTMNVSYILPIGFLYLFFFDSMPPYIAQALIFSLFILIGYFFFYLFSSEEFPKSSYEKILGSIFYVFNMYFILNLSDSSILLLPYLILPLQLFFIHKIIKSHHYFLYAVGFALATIIMGGANIPLAIINFIVSVFYTLHLLHKKNYYTNFKNLLLKLISVSIITLLSNLYWMVGFLLNYLSMRQSLLQNIVGAETYVMDNSSTSYLNIFRMLGLWSFSQGVKAPYYNYSPIYLLNPFFMFTLFIIPIVILLGLFFLKDKLRKYFFILLLFVITIPLEVGANQGIFKPIYLWFYFHIPFFAMFRNTYKFAQIYLFALSFFLVVILLNIKNKKYRLFFSLGVGLIILINAFPFFTGRIFEKSKEIKGIPQYYYSAQQFFQKDKTNYRIFLLPQQYFAQYTWGFTGGNPEIIWGKGIVARQPGTANQTPNNTLSLEVYHDLVNHNYVDANNTFRILNVKYIVQRNDFAWYSDIKFSSSPASIAAMLKPYKKIATFGKLDVYQVPSASESSLFTGGNIAFKQINPVEYQLEIKHVTPSVQLKFLESYHQYWKLYPAKSTFPCDAIAQYSNGVTECKPENKWLNFSNIAYLFKPKLFDTTHKVLYGYANEWTISPRNFAKDFPGSVTKNSDGSENVYLSVYFIQQSYMDTVYLISGATILVSLIYAGYLLYRRKNEK